MTGALEVASEQRATRRVTLSETEVAYIYNYGKKADTIVAEGELRGVELPQDFCKQNTYNEYNCEAETMISIAKRRKMKEYAENLESVLPELESMDITKMSILEIEGLEEKIIDRLDSLRRIDKATGELIESEDFLILEEKLWLVQGILRCWSQEIYSNRLTSSSEVEVSSVSSRKSFDSTTSSVKSSASTDSTPSTPASKSEIMLLVQEQPDSFREDELSVVVFPETQFSKENALIVKKKTGVRRLLRNLLPFSCLALKVKDLV